MEIIFETITKKDKRLFEKINEFSNENKELKNYYKESEKIEFGTDFIHFKNFCGYLDEEHLVISPKLKEHLENLYLLDCPKTPFNKLYDCIFDKFLKLILRELSKENIFFTLSLFETSVEEGKGNESLIFKLLLLLKKKQEIINSIHIVLSSPHKKPLEYEIYKTVDEVSYVDENVLVDIVSSPEFMYQIENGVIDCRYSPVKVLQYETEETFDTLENRFIKHFLKEIEKNIDEDLKEFSSFEDFKQIKEEIEYTLQSDVFSQVGNLDYFPSNSQVLMKKAGYRELFQIYRLFYSSFTPQFLKNLDLTFSLKDMATLWEYYVLIKLLKKLKEKFGNYRIIEDFEERKKGKTIYETAKFKFRNGLTLYFQPTKRSYSELEFRPDFLIEYKGKKFIFDAKFRIFENNRQDILKNMHYYKDGLRAKFAVAVCLGDNREGKFYSRNSEIFIVNLEKLIKNNLNFNGIGYINLDLKI